MTQKQDLGPGAEKIELERRLDANQQKMDQANRADSKSARKLKAQNRNQPDPNESVREALDKSRRN
ncbi:MAG: hypothetical protein M3O62_10555 [Pseudomonadota bacterium]|nr:hypothetical protein [Pseudomonadota bacterium]